jgi:sec-independent protein translocase protein TatB
MFENMGWGEILVPFVAGLFILGPERLPEATAWVGRTLRQARQFAYGAREQLRSELGPQYDELRRPLDELRAPLDELRALRDFDPRTAMTRTLFDDQPAMKPNGFVPPRGEVRGEARPAAGQPWPHPAAEPPRPLAPGERPPIDPDAT